MLRPGLAFFVLLVFQDSRHGHGFGQTLLDSSRLDENETLNFEAISNIHLHLDDDKNGKVDISESDEFMRDELKLTDEIRHHHFHGNDTLISVEELWKSWVMSEVHNWTSAQVVNWLVDYVHLPQYVDIFRDTGINGTMLPRLAVQHNSFLLNGLGVKDAKHRKKISLRAMDIILFGPPASGHNFIKDIIVAFSVLVATVGCWLAVHQKRRAKKQMEQVMRDLKVLQQAEQNFGDLQTRLSKAEEEHQIAIQEKQGLEMRLLEEMETSKCEAERLQDAREGTKEQLERLKYAEQELAQFRKALRKAEKELELQSWKAPAILKQWLQMTYSRELRHFQAKRAHALRQMEEAKEACERIRKKRNSFIGSFRMAHDLTIDEVDQCILSARSSLAEVTNELEERQHRWSQIESLCGLQIMSNYTPSTSGHVTRQRTGSAIAQALANVANIGSVGSGRKISESTPPDKDSLKLTGVHQESKDLPPTYSSVTVHTAAEEDAGSESSADQTNAPADNPVCASSMELCATKVAQETGSDESRISNSEHTSLTVVVTNGYDHSGSSGSHEEPVSSAQKSSGDVKTRTSITKLLLPVKEDGQGEATPLTNGNSDSPPGNKYKKRLSWFSKRQDSFSEGESSTDNDEECRRRKIKWRWKRAAMKSTAKDTREYHKTEGKTSRSASSEKLKISGSQSSEKLKISGSQSSEMLKISGSQSGEKLKAG